MEHVGEARGDSVLSELTSPKHQPRIPIPTDESCDRVLLILFLPFPTPVTKAKKLDTNSTYRFGDHLPIMLLEFFVGGCETFNRIGVQVTQELWTFGRPLVLRNIDKPVGQRFDFSRRGQASRGGSRFRSGLRDCIRAVSHTPYSRRRTQPTPDPIT
jgi:hypothetical protein